MSIDATLQMVRIVLHRAWDPIGIRGIEGADDEYDMYAPDVLAMLKSNATSEMIGDYLDSVARDRMGLTPNPDWGKNIGEMLRQLYTIRQ